MLKRTFSIQITLFIRMVTSVAFFLSILLLGNILYDYGRIEELSIGIAILFSVLNIIIMLTWCCSIEGMYVSANPGNYNYVKRYRFIFFCELITMSTSSFIWGMNNFTQESRDVYNCFIIIMAAIIFICHYTILNNYWKLPDGEIENLIDTYKIASDDDLLSRMAGIRKNAYVMFGYLIAVGSILEVLTKNVIITVLFIIINMVFLKDICKKTVIDYNEIFSTGVKKRDKIVILQIISSTVGILLVYAIQSGFIYRFERVSIEDICFLFLIFYSPIYVIIIKCFFYEKRMVSKWVR